MITETNAELLETIKSAPRYPACNEDFGIVKLYRDDFDKLIQLAERVGELDKTIFSLSFALEYHSGKPAKEALEELLELAKEALAGERHDH
ncbi:hypothetical protein [Sporosarcina sp. Te-1]|uniref:hypothetical protein n=1 Tax=Sporosarcina sp. Te-1 TaxID=2818390 RepID=UPI001A9D9ECE|nr:hypothetical protein [Sporosarcina sp. Te-1]QTD40609.1 hypothetical protein J3U78_17875 [Sporosarcina sp. Te-1]